MAEKRSMLGTSGAIASDKEKTGNITIDKYMNIHIDPGDSYYSIRVAGARAVIPEKGKFSQLFERAKYVVVTSKASVRGVPELAGVNGLNWVQDVKQGAGFSLGFRILLADCVPAIGTSLSIEFEYKIVQESPITKFIKSTASFINGADQPLGGVLSMDPVRLATVQVVSSVASRISETLFPVENQLEALKFSGQWQLHHDLKSSYYFIISAFEDQSLEDASKLRVERVSNASSIEAVLKYENGTEYKDSSYVILEVTYLPVLDDSFNPYWLDLYKEAEEYANDFNIFNPNPTDEERRKAWAECDGIIKQAKAFADQDKRYLEKEKEGQHKLYRSTCMKLITQKQPKPFEIDPTTKLTSKKFFAELKNFQELREASGLVRDVSGLVRDASGLIK